MCRYGSIMCSILPDHLLFSILCRARESAEIEGVGAGGSGSVEVEGERGLGGVGVWRLRERGLGGVGVWRSKEMGSRRVVMNVGCLPPAIGAMADEPFSRGLIAGEQ